MRPESVGVRQSITVSNQNLEHVNVKLSKKLRAGIPGILTRLIEALGRLLGVGAHHMRITQRMTKIDRALTLINDKSVVVQAGSADEKLMFLRIAQRLNDFLLKSTAPDIDTKKIAAFQRLIVQTAESLPASHVRRLPTACVRSLAKVDHDVNHQLQMVLRNDVKVSSVYGLRKLLGLNNPHRVHIPDYVHFPHFDCKLDSRDFLLNMELIVKNKAIATDAKNEKEKILFFNTLYYVAASCPPGVHQKELIRLAAVAKELKLDFGPPFGGVRADFLDGPTTDMDLLLIQNLLLGNGERLKEISEDQKVIVVHSLVWMLESYKRSPVSISKQHPSIHINSIRAFLLSTIRDLVVGMKRLPEAVNQDDPLFHKIIARWIVQQIRNADANRESFMASSPFSSGLAPQMVPSIARLINPGEPTLLERIEGLCAEISEASKKIAENRAAIEKQTQQLFQATSEKRISDQKSADWHEIDCLSRQVEKQKESDSSDIYYMGKAVQEQREKDSSEIYYLREANKKASSQGKKSSSLTIQVRELKVKALEKVHEERLGKMLRNIAAKHKEHEQRLKGMRDNISMKKQEHSKHIESMTKTQAAEKVAGEQNLSQLRKDIAALEKKILALEKEVWKVLGSLMDQYETTTRAKISAELNVKREQLNQLNSEILELSIATPLGDETVHQRRQRVQHANLVVMDKIRQQTELVSAIKKLEGEFKNFDAIPH